MKKSLFCGLVGILIPFLTSSVWAREFQLESREIIKTHTEKLCRVFVQHYPKGVIKEDDAIKANSYCVDKKMETYSKTQQYLEELGKSDNNFLQDVSIPYCMEHSMRRHYGPYRDIKWLYDCLLDENTASFRLKVLMEKMPDDKNLQKAIANLLEQGKPYQFVRKHIELRKERFKGFGSASHREEQYRRICNQDAMWSDSFIQERYDKCYALRMKSDNEFQAIIKQHVDTKGYWNDTALPYCLGDKNNHTKYIRKDEEDVFDSTTLVRCLRGEIRGHQKFVRLMKSRNNKDEIKWLAQEAYNKFPSYAYVVRYLKYQGIQ